VIMAEKFIVFGPPGTGKTHRLSHYVESAAGKYGGSKVMASSYTRSAAAVLAVRVDLPEHNVGTLHSFCFRALGHPELAEKHKAEFSEEYPAWRLGANKDKRNIHDPYSSSESISEIVTTGERLLAELEICRAKQIPRDRWRSHVAAFADVWTRWKEANGMMDFTDLLETCLAEVDAAPGNPTVGFLDEAQDCSRLQMALFCKWSDAMQTVVIAGDDDQCLYDFAGADSSALLDLDVPEANKRFLTQSYRVPGKVHDLAQRWISRLSRRQAKDYQPRRTPAGDIVPGELKSSAASYRFPEKLLRDACPYLSAGKTVMFLTSCGYMLDPLKSVLRKQVIPFHNPYRNSRSDWNPLRPGTSKQMMPIDRVLAFLRPDKGTWGAEAGMWSRHHLRAWVEHLVAKGMLQSGSKERLKAFKNDPAMVSVEDVQSLFVAEIQPQLWDILENLGSGESVGAALQWWQSRCLASKRKPLEFPCKVASKYGGSKLLEPPQIIVGTVHSVKGGEADVVFLMPDVSKSGMGEWVGSVSGRDALRRLFYVGMTRARETLVLCAPVSAHSVQLRAG
jgi:DNA helicase-2/ATP-dependent DNA helicase PcrA